MGKKKETILNKLIGIGFMIAGGIVWSVDYFILRALSAIGNWLAELMNAPTGVGTGITILISLLCLGILISIVIVGAWLIWLGTEIYSSN